MLNIFSVRDAAVEAYMQPFFAPTKGAAIRSLTEAVNDPKHEFFKHAADYGLYFLGSYDDATGLIVVHGPPSHVIECRDLITKA